MQKSKIVAAAFILIVTVMLISLVAAKGWQDKKTGFTSFRNSMVQGICNNWAEMQGIMHIQCVGEWAIQKGQCAWKCTSF